MTGTQAKPLVLSHERAELVKAALNRAYSALLDAQIEMLVDSPAIYEHELSKRLSPSLYQSYQLAEKAENDVVNSLRALEPAPKYLGELEKHAVQNFYQI